MLKRRLIRIAALSAVALVVAAVVVWWQAEQEGGQPGRAMALIGASAPNLGGPFTLTDDSGAAVTDRSYAGRYMLVYFGYALCPDICPTELDRMARALDLLGPAAERVQPLFITVDPERDTVETMHDYVRQFHPRLVGLTGTPEQIAQVARAYRVYFARVALAGTDTYTMDHSSFVYLMGPDGRSLTVFPTNTTAEAMAEGIRSRMDPAG